MAAVAGKYLRIAHREEFPRWSAHQKKPMYEWGLIIHRPLYGGREAPLRWYLQISDTVRAHGWKQSRTDVCTFLRHARDNHGRPVRITSILFLHVGDFLVVSDGSDMGRFVKMMKRCKTGPVTPVSPDIEATYLGIGIGVGGKQCFYLTQREYQWAE